MRELYNEAEWKKKPIKLYNLRNAGNSNGFLQVDVLHSTFGAIYFWKVSYDKRIHHRLSYFKS